MTPADGAAGRTPQTSTSSLLLDVCSDMRWSNGNPVTRDWLASMLSDVESNAAAYRQPRTDGATRGIRCAAAKLGGWCSRDAGHPGAHESRDPKSRGLVAWWNNEYLR